MNNVIGRWTRAREKRLAALVDERHGPALGVEPSDRGRRRALHLLLLRLAELADLALRELQPQGLGLALCDLEALRGRETLCLHRQAPVATPVLAAAAHPDLGDAL